MTIEEFPSWGHLPEYDNLKARLLSLLPDRPFHPDFYMLEKDEQRIAIVVCDSTKLTLTEWEKLSLPERVPWLEKAIAAFSKPTPKTESTESETPPKSEASLDARALAVFIEHQDWTKKQIASHLKCHEKSLAKSRCPKLAAAIAAFKARDIGVKGTKDADGNLEAWNE